jgi:DNA-binding response OmpR family regulator
MKTILVADDKANIRNLVRDYLEAEGFASSLPPTGAKPFMPPVPKSPT